MKDIQTFINYIHRENKSEIRVFKYWDKAERKVMCPISVKQIPYENKKGDIYYIVNSGGKKDHEIIKFNASFFDLDCGRDEQGNYFPLEKVQDYKTKKLSEISQFQLNPTFVIETRITNRGYVTENELIFYLSNTYRWEITKIQLKRIRGQLPELGFKRIRTNKKLKEEFGITSNGYPFIIVKGD